MQSQKPSRNHSRPPETVADWGEFGFIEALCQRLPPASGTLRIGIGDDASWWRPESGNGILTTTDMLVAGVHFDLSYTSAADLGYKSLAVNLSDLAAMGAKPVCVYLSLGLPAALKKTWLDEFIDAFLELAEVYDVQLAGGDTVAARELVISVTLNGLAPAPSPLLRSGAVVGDDIYVSGSIGDSFLGLQLLQGCLQPDTNASAATDFLQSRHLRPQARIALGEQLVASGRVSAMLDVSDGVVADLDHILVASGGLGAEIEGRRIPLSPAARQFVAAGRIALRDLLTGGEDYELLFTAAPAGRKKIAEVATRTGVDLTRIGQITEKDTILLFANGVFEELSGRGGYDHFHN